MSENNLPNEGMENEEAVNSVEEIETEAAEIDMEEGQIVEDGEVLGETDAAEETVAVVMSPEQKKIKQLKNSLIVVSIIAALLLCGNIYYYMTNIFNRYNHIGYLNVNGYTIGEVVAGMGMGFDEFKEMYGLPKDLRKDTYMNAAQSLIPVAKMAELNGTDINGLRETYKFGEEITEKSTWGQAIDSMSLKDYVGEEQLAEFKTKYELGDEITGETKWGTIRKNVEKKQVAERLAAEKEAASPSPSASAPADEPENIEDNAETDVQLEADEVQDTADTAAE